MFKQPTGIEVNDCAVVKIAEDIPKELIVERLQIADCGIVRCSEEQEEAVSMICSDVGIIGNSEEQNSTGIGDMLKNVTGGLKGAPNTKVINAAEYVL